MFTTLESDITLVFKLLKDLFASIAIIKKWVFNTTGSRTAALYDLNLFNFTPCYLFSINFCFSLLHILYLAPITQSSLNMPDVVLWPGMLFLHYPTSHTHISLRSLLKYQLLAILSKITLPIPLQNFLFSLTALVFSIAF